MHRLLPAPLSVYAALIAASLFSVQNALAGQAPASVALQRDFEVTARYLHIPIKNGAPKRLVTTRVDGRVMVKNTIELADTEPDWWAPMDVGAWRGRTVTLQVDKLPEGSRALSQIEPGDDLKDAEDLYREPLRGQLRFSPRRGWNNDPNGMVYFNGEYHLFFQHNPYGWRWGNMHWGHAVSRDMVHWRELGIALAPDESGPMFSGTAVVDWQNTSGFGADGKPPLVLAYTAAGDPAVQSLAYSTDGRTFTKFDGNPVVPQITPGNRDPKVFWHQPTGKWVMVLYVEQPKGRHTMRFLTSPNLRSWTTASVVEGVPGTKFLHECPEFFELAVDGDPAHKKWVIFGADSDYATGTFDGTRFTAEQTRLTGHRGPRQPPALYAAQTFNDIPANDGRRILMGWFRTFTNGMPFNQSMSLPVELKLVSTPEGPRLSFTPIRELESLRVKTHDFGTLRLEPGGPNPLAGVQSELVELRAEFEPGETGGVVFTVRGATIAYDAAKQELAINGHPAPAPLRGGRQRLIIFCDRTGLEVHAADCLTYIPMPFQPQPANLSLGVESKGIGAKFQSLQVHELRSAWNAD